jgi:uncharacterized protein
VLGRGFTRDTVITVGGRRARVLAVRNPRAVFAIVPRGVGTEVVRAATQDGTSVRNARSLVHYANRVLIVGDSVGIDLGWGFTPTLELQEDLTMTDDAVGSSGLVRTDFYDWPAHLRADIALTHPDVVMTLFGTNDEQAISASAGIVEPGTAAWDRLYAARVRHVAKIVHHAGATLLWIGLPRMGPQSVLSQQFVSNLDRLDRAVVASVRRATFVDAWHLFTTARGTYTPYVELSPHDWALGHSGDGTHLTSEGAAVIDAKALEDLRLLLTRH